MMPGVYRVDLFTRQISCPDVDWSYGEPTEMLTSGTTSVLPTKEKKMKLFPDLTIPKRIS